MTAKTVAKAPAKKPKTTKSTKAAKVTKKPTVKAEVVKKSLTSAPKADPKRGLRLWNIRLGVVLLLLAAAVVVVGNAISVPVTTQYLAKDALAAEAAGGAEVLATATRQLADVHVSWLVAKFLIIFGALFLLLATVWRKHYEAWLDRGVNKARWLGFGLGTGAMAVTVAMLSGISDIGYLLLIFASLAILGSLSSVVELIGPGRKLRKYVIITALGTAALPVVAIGLTLLGVALYNGSLPTYIYFVYGSMLLFAVAFALACIMRLRQRGKWADVFYAERAFMFLGFSAATVLALQIFAGVLQ